MRNSNKVPVAKILDAQDKELMAIRKLERDGNALVIRGKIFGAMPMVAKLTPEEARAALHDTTVQTPWRGFARLVFERRVR